MIGRATLLKLAAVTIRYQKVSSLARSPLLVWALSMCAGRERKRQRERAMLDGLGNVLCGYCRRPMRFSHLEPGAEAHIDCVIFACVECPRLRTFMMPRPFNGWRQKYLRAVS